MILYVKYIIFAALAVIFQEMKYKYPLAEIILFHRKKAGLTQKELADLAGTGKTVVYDLEKGKSTIQLNTLQKILDALNINIQFRSPLMDEFDSTKNENS